MFLQRRRVFCELVREAISTPFGTLPAACRTDSRPGGCYTAGAVVTCASYRRSVEAHQPRGEPSHTNRYRPSTFKTPPYTRWVECTTDRQQKNDTRDSLARCSPRFVRRPQSRDWPETHGRSGRLPDDLPQKLPPRRAETHHPHGMGRYRG